MMNAEYDNIFIYLFIGSSNIVKGHDLVLYHLVMQYHYCLDCLDQ